VEVIASLFAGVASIMLVRCICVCHSKETRSKMDKEVKY
jgi:hypothetical protein